MASRRPRRRTGTVRRNPSYYLMPLGISIGIVIMVTLLFNVYSHMQAQQAQALKSEPIAQISIENDNTAIIFNNERTKVDKGYRIDWNNGEGIETGENARLFIPLATKDQMRLDSNSTVFAKRDEGRSVVLAFNKGNMWLRTEQSKPATEASIIRMDRIRMTMTDKATVALADNGREELVAVVEGSVPVQVTNQQGAVIKTVTVGVGQQLRVVSGEGNADTFENVLEAIPATTTSSDWFTWNTSQDQAIDAYEGSGEAATVTAGSGNPGAVTFTNINPTATFRNRTVNLQGGYDPEEVATLRINEQEATLSEESKTWKVTLELNTGTNTLKTVYTKPDGSEVTHSERTVSVDEAGPESPKLTSPSGSTVTSAHVVLSGTVGPEAYRVRVNDYELKKFVPGETAWTYHLNADDNMRVGTNTYTVTAYDEVGNQSDPLVIVLTYTPSATPAATVTTNANANTNTAATTVAPKTNQNKNTNTPAAVSPTPKKPAPTEQPAATITPKPTTNNNGGGALTPTNVRSGTGSGL